jgi:hypothetical protein
MVSLPPTLQKILSTKYFLYFVTFLAIINVIFYMKTNNYRGLTAILIVGYLSSFFTKNMVYILGSTLIISNFIDSSKCYIEGMKNKSNDGEKGKHDKKTEKTKQAFTQKNIPSSKPAPVSEDMEEEEIGGRIDYASTLEQAYDNLQGMIGNDGIQSLTKDTQNLISQQKSLMGTMSDMGPMLKMAKETLGSFNGGEMKEAMESLGNIMGGFKKQ